MLEVKTIIRVCAQNHSGAQFIVPSQGPITGTSTVTGTAGYWEGELRGSCRIMTSRT